LGARKPILGRLRSLREDAGLVRLVRNSAWLFSASGAALVLSVPQTILVTRAVGASQYGVIVIVMTFVTTCNLVTAFRMNEFVVKYVAEALAGGRREAGGATIKVAMLAEACSSLVAFAGIWLLASLGADIFLDGETGAGLIHLYAPFVLCNLVFESASGVLQATDRFRLQAQIAVAGHVAKFIGVVLAAVGPQSVRAFLLADLAGQAVTAGALTVAAWREASRRFGGHWWRAPLRSLAPTRRAMLHFAVNTNVSGTFSAIHKNAEPLLIGSFRSSAEAGYFNLALRVVTLAMRPIEPMAKAIYPESTRQLAQGDTAGAAALWRKGSLVAAAWIVPVSVALAPASFWLVPRLFGESFSSAAPAVCLLLPGIAVSFVVFWARPALLALGFPGYATLVNVGLGVLKIGLSLLVVPLYGYLGSAALASVLTLGALWLLVRRVLAGLAQRSGQAPPPESRSGAVPTTPDPSP
jgi:O-antigen/teichoic acid export membrane protein